MKITEDMPIVPWTFRRQMSRRDRHRQRRGSGRAAFEELRLAPYTSAMLEFGETAMGKNQAELFEKPGGGGPVQRHAVGEICQERRAPYWRGHGRGAACGARHAARIPAPEGGPLRGQAYGTHSPHTGNKSELCCTRKILTY